MPVYLCKHSNLGFKWKQTAEKETACVTVSSIQAALKVTAVLLCVIHVKLNNKREKISRWSWLNHFCNFNINKYRFNLHSEDYNVFFLYILYIILQY